MSEFKISLKAARVNAGMTQEAVADKLSISRQTLVNYETGRTAPDIVTLKKLASLYNVSINRISFFADDP